MNKVASIDCARTTPSTSLPAWPLEALKTDFSGKTFEQVRANYLENIDFTAASRVEGFGLQAIAAGACIGVTARARANSVAVWIIAEFNRLCGHKGIADDELRVAIVKHLTPPSRASHRVRRDLSRQSERTRRGSRPTRRRGSRDARP